MERWLFIITHLEMGGVQKSLEALLTNLKKDNRIEINILVLNENKQIEIDIPEGIVVSNGGGKLFSTFATSYTTSFSKIDKKNFKMLFIKFITSAFKKSKYGYKLTNFMIKSLRLPMNSYDVVISFDGMPTLSDEIAKRIPVSSHLISWIHSDPDFFGNSIKDMIAKGHYDDFFRIVSVSEASRMTLININPNLESKTIVRNNLILKRNIIKLSNEYEKKISSDKYNIVTIARIDNKSKRFDRILEVAKILIEEQVDFTWTIIGDGIDYLWLEQNIVNMNLDKNITLTGYLKNPYPYLKTADLLALLSDYEGYPVILEEANVLETYFLITNFRSAEEIIKNGLKGEIVSWNPQEIANKIKELSVNTPDLKSTVLKNEKIPIYEGLYNSNEYFK